MLHMRDTELFATIGLTSPDDEETNNLLRERKKVVYMPSANRHYVMLTAECIKKHVLYRFDSFFDCYVNWMPTDEDLLLSSATEEL